MWLVFLINFSKEIKNSLVNSRESLGEFYPGPRVFLLIIIIIFIWKLATRSADQNAELREKKASGQEH